MIFLHVGYPKVASTTIQHFLASNRSALAERGYIYPDLSPDRKVYGIGPNGHNSLSVEMRRGEPGAVWRELESLLVGDGAASNVVLSSEAMISANPGTLHKWLGHRDATIVFYVRDFSQLLVSQYAHQTKLGASTVDFDAFFDRRLRRPQLFLSQYIKGWADVFGNDNIRVRMLDEHVLVEGDVRTDILDAIGLSPDAYEADAFKKPRSANLGLGWKTVEILRDLYQSLIPTGTGSDAFQARTRALQARKQRLKSPVLDFAASVAVPAARIGQELGFTDRGSYLLQDQIDLCVGRFNTEVSALGALGFGSNLRPVSSDGMQPRGFLPSIDEIPPEEVALFLRKLVPNVWDRMITKGDGSENASGPTRKKVS